MGDLHGIDAARDVIAHFSTMDDLIEAVREGSLSTSFSGQRPSDLEEALAMSREQQPQGRDQGSTHRVSDYYHEQQQHQEQQQQRQHKPPLPPPGGRGDGGNRGNCATPPMSHAASPGGYSSRSERESSLPFPGSPARSSSAAAGEYDDDDDGTVVTRDSVMAVL